MRIDEQQKRGLNGELELMKTTSLRDANGGWDVYEVGEWTTKEDDGNRSTEERISRRDFEGNISPVSEGNISPSGSRDCNESQSAGMNACHLY